ncbi:MAG: SpoIIE family protein phosphatase [Acidimicrobiales bacterium]|nr:SpoIIE family protein phosphatase [Acidimicrobiales bacterium]
METNATLRRHEDRPLPAGRAIDRPRDASAARLAPRAAEGVVLLVEDDDGDALLVEELLEDASERFELRRARTLTDAVPVASGVDVVVVDLGLPDSMGLGAVQRLRRAAPDVPLVVLTGANDRARGLAALAGGAQDYLVKGEVDGAMLGRSIRYAVERARAESAGRRLLLAEQRHAENERLARGLLPRLEVGGRGVGTATRYLPGGKDALLGGDFFDAVQRPDGTVRAVIGDVCGHGPAEAAIGVALRIAWRTMVLADAPPDEVLGGVDEVLRAERDRAATFATVCDVTLCARQQVATLRLHGHPPPLLVVPTVRLIEADAVSPPLGIVQHVPAQPVAVRLAERWAMLLTTDGLHEVRVGADRLGLERLVELAAAVDGWRDAPDAALAALLDAVAEQGGTSFSDDVAMLWLGAQ